MLTATFTIWREPRVHLGPFPGSNPNGTTLINEAPPSNTALIPRLKIAEVFEPFNPDEKEYPYNTPDIPCGPRLKNVKFNPAEPLRVPVLSIKQAGAF